MPSKQPAGLRLPISLELIALLIVLLFLPAMVRAQSEDEQLGQLLRRLGLVELEARLHEQALAASAPAERLERARQLADLYAEQLMAALEDEQRYRAVSERIEALLKEIPEARTPSLDVMLLQADYQRAEGLISRAMLEPQAPELLRQADELLRRVTPLLDRRQQEFWKRVDELNQQIEATNNETVITKLESDLQRHLVLAGRAAYFAGWSFYYRGVLTTPPDVRDFEAARAIFRRVLDVTEEDQQAGYRNLNVEALDLGSSWRARAVIGLGLCEAGLKNVEASRNCFALLADKSVPDAVRDQTAYWFLQGLLNGGNGTAAVEYAQQQLAALSLPATQGQVSFYAAALRAGLHAWHGLPPQAALAEIGKTGLAKLKQSKLLAELLARYGGSLEDAESFALRWLRGQQLRKTADASKKEEDYQSAIDALKTALDAPDAKNDVTGSNRCRMELAWCYYQLRRDEQAADLYRQAAEGLRAAKAEGAADAGWMAFVARHRLALQDASAQTAVQAALAWLQREFPGHQNTKRAEFIAAKLKLQSASPDEQRATLAAVAPGDPNYVSARAQLATLLYEQWKASDSSARAAAEARAVIEGTLELQSSQLEAERRAQLRLMLVDMALSAEPPDPSTAETQLAAVSSALGSTDSASSDLGAEYHYRRIQLARLRSDDAAERASARWFVRNGAGTRWELAGLVAAARHLDQQFESARADAREEAAQQALHVYDRLVELLGADPATLAEKRNAQVAMSKRALYAHRLGQLSAAAESLDRLLEAFPREKSYLRRAGQVAHEQRQFEKALGYWRQVLAGSRAGTEEWYEAKYYQLACLVETDRAAAAQVFKQLQLLAPDLGPAPWREKFQQLESRL